MQTLLDWLVAVLKDGRFWGALILLIDRLRLYFLPQFPQDIWTALLGLVIAILAISGIVVARQEVRVVRTTRAAAASMEATRP